MVCADAAHAKPGDSCVGVLIDVRKVRSSSISRFGKWKHRTVAFASVRSRVPLNGLYMLGIKVERYVQV